jgi:hypothetical protein
MLKPTTKITPSMMLLMLFVLFTAGNIGRTFGENLPNIAFLNDSYKGCLFDGLAMIASGIFLLRVRLPDGTYFIDKNRTEAPSMRLRIWPRALLLFIFVLPVLYAMYYLYLVPLLHK